jgi:hypothetical protein
MLLKATTTETKSGGEALMSTLLAGFIAGIPLAVILVIYALVRGKVLVEFFKSTDEDLAKLGDRAFYLIILGMFVLMGLIFGTVSGLVYGWVSTTTIFRAIALGAAAVFTLAALISKTPLAADKIFWNLAVGGVLGVLVPMLAG